MIYPFNPFDLHVLWFQSWRAHIRNAKENPKEREGYAKAALIAHAYYEIEAALYRVRMRTIYD